MSLYSREPIVPSLSTAHPGWLVDAKRGLPILRLPDDVAMLRGLERRLKNEFRRHGIHLPGPEFVTIARWKLSRLFLERRRGSVSRLFHGEDVVLRLPRTGGGLTDFAVPNLPFERTLCEEVDIPDAVDDAEPFFWATAMGTHRIVRGPDDPWLDPANPDMPAIDPGREEQVRRLLIDSLVVHWDQRWNPGICLVAYLPLRRQEADTLRVLVPPAESRIDRDAAEVVGRRLALLAERLGLFGTRPPEPDGSDTPSFHLFGHRGAVNIELRVSSPSTIERADARRRLRALDPEFLA
jgi:hypothetical protein